MTGYIDALTEAMTWFGQQPGAVVLGQGVAVSTGTTMTPTFANVSRETLLEMPVAEELQTGMAVGMALAGMLPLSVIPRWNFMLRAADQLVNHLDRLPLYSDGGYRPRVLIRTAVPSADPFNPGPQHDDDFTAAFRAMLRTVDVVCLHEATEIVPAYKRAVDSDRSTILVEWTHYYRNARAQPR